jgi:hypothetical protein
MKGDPNGQVDLLLSLVRAGIMIPLVFALAVTLELAEAV